MSLYLLIITVALSALCFYNEQFFNQLLFIPYRIKHNNEWWRFITHGFAHADFPHLIFNMLALYFFGPLVEGYFQAYFGTLQGSIYFVLMYISGIAVAALPSYKKEMYSSNYSSVGASGAVSAVLFASIVFNPLSRMCLYGLLCFPGIIWGGAYLAYSYYMTKQQNEYINHDAHLAGALYGIVFTVACKPSLAILCVQQFF
ncbi:MAG: rhomboid family intramembrane serine protease [Bacteroidia bacterium]|nr:rhomboid family intramembrane serine protease [Bacteroidia bacterium]